MSEKDVAVMA